MMTTTIPSPQVMELLQAYQFSFVKHEDRRDSNGLLRAVEIQFTAPNGKLIQAEAFIREIDELQGYFGSVTDPCDDNSTEFDYIDCMGTTFEGCLIQAIRAVADHYQ